jgi:glycosyltransferase involved in cell wall biosynthesis
VQASCVALDAHDDRVRFVALRSASAGRLGRVLAIPRLAARLWRAVGDASTVHAGPSELTAPMENLALVVAWLRRRRRVYVIDIDWRNSAAMNLRTGVWSYGVYWRRKYIHNVWQALQTHAARWFCDLVMLKGKKLVADFGRGAPHVKWLLDAAHSADMVLDESEQARKRASYTNGDTRLRCVYFGRLTRYKGVEVMLRAIAEARRAGADVTFDVFGGGEDEAHLQRIAVELGTSDVVTFHGARPYGREFLAGLTDFDLLLAAPLSEDTPRSALDAQTRGIPILAFDTYYYEELEAMGAGVTCVPWLDTSALAERLVAFAKDRTGLATMVDQGVRFARENTQEIWLARRAEWTAAIGRRQ